MNKKLVYITFLNEDLRPGYKNKVHGQVRAFHKLGCDTELFICSDSTIRKYKVDENKSILVYEKAFKHKRKNTERNIYDEFFNFVEFSAFIIEYLKNNEVKYVYMRRIIPLNNRVIRMLKVCHKKETKVIYEYPTLPWGEEVKQNPTTGLKMKFFYLMEQIYYKSLQKYVDCFTYIGRYDGKDGRYLQIQNAGCPDDYPIVEKKQTSEDIRMLGVAHVGYWTGYDLMIEALAEYYKSSPTKIVYFDIVGTVDPSLKLEEKVKKLGLSKYVLFHGMKIGYELDDFFNNADIGVNVLRLDSKSRKLEAMATLKTIEYTFRGLPQIATLPFQIDCTQKDNPDFLLIVKGESIDLQSIVDFVMQTKDSQMIRDYAIKHMSWENVMKSVLDYIKC